MLVLLPTCSARVDDVGNYLERNLDKDYKPEGTRPYHEFMVHPRLLLQQHCNLLWPVTFTVTTNKNPWYLSHDSFKSLSSVSRYCFDFIKPERYLSLSSIFRALLSTCIMVRQNAQTLVGHLITSLKKLDGILALEAEVSHLRHQVSVLSKRLHKLDPPRSKISPADSTPFSRYWEGDSMVGRWWQGCGKRGGGWRKASGGWGRCGGQYGCSRGW